MSKSNLEVRYVLFTATYKDPASPEREYITEFYEEVADDEIEELISYYRPGIEYDYAFVEKQYHRV